MTSEVVDERSAERALEVEERGDATLRAYPEHVVAEEIAVGEALGDGGIARGFDRVELAPQARDGIGRRVDSLEARAQRPRAEAVERRVDSLSGSVNAGERHADGARVVRRDPALADDVRVHPREDRGGLLGEKPAPKGARRRDASTGERPHHRELRVRTAFVLLLVDAQEEAAPGREQREVAVYASTCNC